MNVSVLVLTLNEENNIHRCLAYLKWCDDVVVLDSYSADRTKEMALSWGARFFQRTFDDYATHRNFGLSEIQYKHPWVLMVDADEIVTPELADEIRLTLQECGPQMSLHHIRRKDFFMGKWIRHSSGYPTWFGRLVKVGDVRVQRAVNEEYSTNGKIGFLKEHLLHYPFRKGFHSWFEKHNRYSSMEAELLSKDDMEKTKFIDLFNKNPLVRRKALKSSVYHLPGRPLLIFLGFYIIRAGFLDGHAGLTYCFLRAFYEFMINCKTTEARLRKHNHPL